MIEPLRNTAPQDPLWDRIVSEAHGAAARDPMMRTFYQHHILDHGSFSQALSHMAAYHLAGRDMAYEMLRELCDEIVNTRCIAGAASADAAAYVERDPACHMFMQPLLFFKGFQALQIHRLAYTLWQEGRAEMAYFFQMRTSKNFGIDIHPGAKMGQGIMIDHAHSIVIGETAVVGNDVSMLHSVTLGGTGKDETDRHPKIGDGVLIGAGAKVLGNIKVGNCARIAAGSVVLHEVANNSTVAGVPAKIVGNAPCKDMPARAMDQLLREIPISQ
jgi:serine O-acetyltransferase